MTDLLTMLREHDLPPKWDGERITWHGWQEPLAGERIWICRSGGGRPKVDRCEGCGSTADQLMNRGCTTDRIGKMHGRPLLRLFAYRCPDCDLDTVLDLYGGRGTWWTLDHTDYGDEGSRRPGADGAAS